MSACLTNHETMPGLAPQQEMAVVPPGCCARFAQLHALYQVIRVHVAHEAMGVADDDLVSAAVDGALDDGIAVTCHHLSERIKAGQAPEDLLGTLQASAALHVDRDEELHWTLPRCDLRALGSGAPRQTLPEQGRACKRSRAVGFMLSISCSRGQRYPCMPSSNRNLARLFPRPDRSPRSTAGGGFPAQGKRHESAQVGHEPFAGVRGIRERRRNATDNPTMGDIIATRYSRRDLMKNALAVTAISATMGPGPGRWPAGRGRGVEASFVHRDRRRRG